MYEHAITIINIFSVLIQGLTGTTLKSTTFFSYPSTRAQSRIWESLFVLSPMHCASRCLETIVCVGYNIIATFPATGNFRCELINDVNTTVTDLNSTLFLLKVFYCRLFSFKNKIVDVFKNCFKPIYKHNSVYTTKLYEHHV